ncbi:MAG: domain containing protein [Solirubrobacterales bacterium]|jgi:pSer/pThr/pTyr-binding forkhead associated (FHA) protein|nr:domain containing protein [Solirubrobacterales bacterium]
MTDRPDIEHTQILSSRELDRAAFSMPAPAPGRYLAVQSGTELVALALHSGAVTRIGRGLSADVHLDDASVSRRHARIVERGGRAWLLDDRSMNGTWVNGKRVDAAILSHGDEIVLGRVALRFVEVVAEGADAARTREEAAG